jgi:glycosyltransferase involved in cell wall biosynthesis
MQKNMTTKVSILLPSYNYEKYIKEAIDSVLKQTYKNWELIIIDDGSSDNSVNIIKSYKDKRIIFHTQKNQGVTKTLNRALDISSGDYICFLDADDVYHPEKLEKQVEMMKSGYDMVTTQVEAINDEGEPSNDKFFNLWWNTFNPKIVFGKNIEFNFFNGNYLCKSALMLKRELFDKYGKFNTKLITAYDLELWLKMLPHIKINRCEHVLTYYRWHGLNETSTNTLRMRIELLLIYDKYLESLKLSIKEDPKRVNKFILGFIYYIRIQGLQDAYITLQILKQDKDSTIDSYDYLYQENALNILKKIVENKDLDFKFVKKGQDEKIEKLLRENIFQKLRRTLIPYKVRKLTKALLKRNARKHNL